MDFTLATFSELGKFVSKHIWAHSSCFSKAPDGVRAVVGSGCSCTERRRTRPTNCASEKNILEQEATVAMQQLPARARRELARARLQTEPTAWRRWPGGARRARRRRMQCWAAPTRWTLDAADGVIGRRSSRNHGRRVGRHLCATTLPTSASTSTTKRFLTFFLFK